MFASKYLFGAVAATLLSLMVGCTASGSAVEVAREPRAEVAL
jgi:hypothetical protein